MPRIAFQSFNAANPKFNLFPKKYQLELNTKFINQLKQDFNENDLILLGLQEEKRGFFLQQYRQTLKKQGIQSTEQRPRVTTTDYTLYQKVLKYFTNLFSCFRNVKTAYFKSLQRSKQYKNGQLQIQKQSTCKSGCGFTSPRMIYKSGAVTEFLYNGITICIINTHLHFEGKEKTNFGLETRIQQFKAILDFILQQKKPDECIIIIMGDLNFRFIRGSNQPLTDNLQSWNFVNKEKKCTDDELCSYLHTQSGNINHPENKKKLLKSFYQNLNSNQFPYTCRFNEHYIDDPNQTNFSKVFDLQKDHTKRDPSNCDKILVHIPNNLNGRASFEFRQKPVRVLNSDHAFMFHGSLVLDEKQE